MNILVTDGENRSALAVTRSLGGNGCRVIVVGNRSRTLASSSKFCHKGFSAPDPLVDGEKYVAAISEIALKENVDIIFPVTEQSIYQLNPVREILPKLACPPAETVHSIADKSALCRLAERLDVPIPKTIYLDSDADLSAVVGSVDHYPVVVKPSVSKIVNGSGYLSASVSYANSQEELEHLYATSSVLRSSSMIQEKIIGPGTGLFTLYDGDRHLALFSHRRLREKPPSGGVSVVSESVPLNQELVDAADRLLSAVGWRGVAMVEFKRDQRDGKAKLMEINGRFWGSLQLAVACGVDFPSLLLAQLQGKLPVDSAGDYLVGHKLKWFLGTLDHLIVRMKNNNAKLNLAEDSISKWQSLFDFVRVWEPNTSFDVCNYHDKGPFIYEAYSYLQHAIKGRK